MSVAVTCDFKNMARLYRIDVLQIIVQIILNHSFFLYLPNFLLFAFALIFLQISHTDLAAALAAASYLP